MSLGLLDVLPPFSGQERKAGLCGRFLGALKAHIPVELCTPTCALAAKKPAGSREAKTPGGEATDRETDRETDRLTAERWLLQPLGSQLKWSDACVPLNILTSNNLASKMAFTYKAN